MHINIRAFLGHTHFKSADAFRHLVLHFFFSFFIHSFVGRLVRYSLLFPLLVVRMCVNSIIEMFKWMAKYLFGWAQKFACTSSKWTVSWTRTQSARGLFVFNCLLMLPFCAIVWSQNGGKNATATTTTTKIDRFFHLSRLLLPIRVWDCFFVDTIYERLSFWVLFQRYDYHICGRCDENALFAGFPRLTN